MVIVWQWITSATILIVCSYLDWCKTLIIKLTSGWYFRLLIWLRTFKKIKKNFSESVEVLLFYSYNKLLVEQKKIGFSSDFESFIMTFEIKKLSHLIKTLFRLSLCLYWYGKVINYIFTGLKWSRKSESWLGQTFENSCLYYFV